MSERTLLSVAPSRLMFLHYYAAAAVLWILGALAFLDVSNVVPDWQISVIDLRLQSVAGGFLGFLGVLTTLIAEVSRLRTRYVVTDMRVIRREGILRKRTNEMPFNRIERVELDQGLLQRVFRLGVIVLDAGDDAITLDSVGHVDVVHDELTRQVVAHAKRG